jgi:hypothetical protein
MKHIEHERRIWGKPGYKIMLGSSQWGDGVDRSVAYAWRDKNGKFSRGSTRELPVSALPLLAVYAIEHGYLTAQDFVNAVRELDETPSKILDAKPAAGEQP